MNDKQINFQVVLRNLEKEANPSIKKLHDLQVTTPEEFETASKLLKSIKEIAKLAKEKEDKITVPLNQVIKEARSLFKPFRDLVALTEADTKSKLVAYIETQERKALALDAKFAEGKIKKVSTLVAKRNSLETISEVAQIRKVWKVIEVDATKTPREFMMPDMDKIKEALEAGRKVPGWDYKQVNNIAI